MAKHYYFVMTWGLRGCYMPDGEPVALMVRTRRELKEAIADQANMLTTDETLGFSRKAIASYAALCWHEAHKAKPAYLPYALPYKERGESSYHNAIFVSVVNRAEYLEHQNAGD